MRRNIEVRGTRIFNSTLGHNNAQADQLVIEGATLPAGEARRRFAKALALLRGQARDLKREFIWSLTLRSNRVIADSSHPPIVALVQICSATRQARRARFTSA